MPFGDEWTADQQVLANVVMQVWAEHGDWPSYSYVADTLDDRGIDAAQALRSFPELGRRSVTTRAYADVVYDHTHPTPPEDSKVALSVAGLFRHPDGSLAARAFIAVVDLLAERWKRTKRDPTEPLQVQLTSAQVEQLLPHWYGPWIRPVFKVMQSEPLAGVLSWQSNPQTGAWLVTVGRQIGRYLDLTMDGYLDLLRGDLEVDAELAGKMYPMTAAEPQWEASVSAQPPTVFLVHGHDAAAKHHVARVIRSLLGEDPVILDEQASQGKTVIEKFEAYGKAAGYAVVLLTADDQGGPRGGELRPRARQNVVLELGYFLGQLGRSNVAALTKGNPELPSDYAGVIYISLDDTDWPQRLAKEMRSAGLPADLNNL